MEHGSYDACEYYRRALVVLAQRARDAGVVLTLETEPLKPLAMGHYCQRAEARPAREVYAGPPQPGRDPAPIVRQLSEGEQRCQPRFPEAWERASATEGKCAVCNAFLWACSCGPAGGHAGG